MLCELTDLGGLVSPVTALHLELHPVAFVEGADPARQDGRIVHEQVGAVGRFDEPVALFRVEPFDGALSQSNLPATLHCPNTLPEARVHAIRDSPQHHPGFRRPLRAWTSTVPGPAKSTA